MALKVATLNVSTFMDSKTRGKGPTRRRQVIECMIEQNAVVLCVQETRITKQGCVELTTENGSRAIMSTLGDWCNQQSGKIQRLNDKISREYRLFNTCDSVAVDRAVAGNGVGVIVKPGVEVIKCWYSSWNVAVWMMYERKVVCVVSTYWKPDNSVNKQKRNAAKDDLLQFVRGEVGEKYKLQGDEQLIIGGDFNGWIGKTTDESGGRRVDGERETMGNNRYKNKDRNPQGKEIIKFAVENKLFIANTATTNPPREDRELITFYRGLKAKTQVDYILVRQGQKSAVESCYAVPSENLAEFGGHRPVKLTWNKNCPEKRVEST